MIQRIYNLLDHLLSTSRKTSWSGLKNLEESVLRNSIILLWFDSFIYGLQSPWMLNEVKESCEVRYWEAPHQSCSERYLYHACNSNLIEYFQLKFLVSGCSLWAFSAASAEQSSVCRGTDSLEKFCSFVIVLTFSDTIYLHILDFLRKKYQTNLDNI